MYPSKHFKVNNRRNTRKKKGLKNGVRDVLLLSLLLTLNIFTPLWIISIVDFEHVFVLLD